MESPDVVTSSGQYKKRFRGETGEWFLREQEKHLLALLDPWKGARILDIGGGHGQYTEQLVKAGFDVTVLGSSINADEQIRSLVESGQCQYVVGNFEKLPAADKSFDVVISFRLMTHLDQWQAFIAETVRVARHAVILDAPVSRSFNYFYPFLFGLKRALEGDTTRTFRVFKEHEVVAEFQKCGYLLTGRNPQYFFPMVVHRTLHAPKLSRKIEQASGSLGLTRRFGSPLVLCFETGAANPKSS